MEEGEFKKILHWNIGIYFIYTTIGIIVVKSSTAKQPVDAITFAVYLAFFMSIHLLFILAKFMICFSREEKKLAKSYLFSFLIILLIGFPTCVLYF